MKRKTGEDVNRIPLPKKAGRTVVNKDVVRSAFGLGRRHFSVNALRSLKETSLISLESGPSPPPPPHPALPRLP